MRLPPLSSKVAAPAVLIPPTSSLPRAVRKPEPLIRIAPFQPTTRLLMSESVALPLMMMPWRVPRMYEFLMRTLHEPLMTMALPRWSRTILRRVKVSAPLQMMACRR